MRLPVKACLFALAALSGAAALAQIEAMPPWREIATNDDRTRLRGWRTAWVRGLKLARESGHADDVAREGPLLDPDAAIDWRDPPAGDYACRMIKVGGKTDAMLDYVAYPAFNCRIRDENGMMSFAKLDGSQRPLGLLLPMQGQRMVFLGTLQLGDERRSLQYGQDRERDMAGVIERIGDRRWRLFFPYPHFESTIDVLELVPKGAS